jgi:hypothetical protein
MRSTTMTYRHTLCSSGLFLAIAACSASAPEPKKEAPVSKLPICKSGADLAQFDGQRVVLVGIYRKRLVAKKMGQPATQFYGRVQIDLTGKATDYDQAAPDRALATVRVGTDRRPDDEIEKFVDKMVAVEGRLVLHPPMADPNVASYAPEPTLFEVGPIAPRD